MLEERNSLVVDVFDKGLKIIVIVKNGFHISFVLDILC